MEIDIYTDGGCSGNPGPGGWAFVILEKVDIPGENLGDLRDKEELRDRAQKILARKWGAEANTTNNRMELSAAVAALSALNLDPKPEKVRVFTDSQYLQKGISQWISRWKKNGWKTASKDTVKNKDLWEKLDLLNISMAVEWHWVKGHDGNKYNELCDQMTQEAIVSLTKEGPGGL
ncbi:MAG: ribonuclease HI [Spirochaetaceae bacterium]|jgi:ribonuclease HI|nr:ribonuclease HI [Spirochaetaceae bacterium]